MNIEDKAYFGQKTKNTTEIAKQVPVKSKAELNALCIAASKKHAGSYIFAYVDFGLANIFKADKLPTNAYASDDWKLGYWKDGVRYAWSEARIAAAQRALDKLSGLQFKPVEDKAYFEKQPSFAIGATVSGEDSAVKKGQSFLDSGTFTGVVTKINRFKDNTQTYQVKITKQDGQGDLKIGQTVTVWEHDLM